jgi:hypothetical protein
MDRIRDHYAKQSKPGSERQRSHVFSHMWNINKKDKCIHTYKHYIYVIIYNIILYNIQLYKSYIIYIIIYK